MKINNQALKMYFQALKIVLSIGINLFVSGDIVSFGKLLFTLSDAGVELFYRVEVVKL
jgi:hypothetical protein